MRRLIAKFRDGATYERLEESTAIDEMRINEILESRQVPGAVTDREFLSGNFNGNQFANTPILGDTKIEQYKRYTGGKMPPKGAVYVDGIARPNMPGDPEAWVESRGDLKRKIESRPGASADGLVKARGPEPIGPMHTRVKLAENIVRKKMRQAIEKNPDLAHVDQGELRHSIIEKHGNPLMKQEVEPIDSSSVLPVEPALEI